MGGKKFKRKKIRLFWQFKLFSAQTSFLDRHVDLVYQKGCQNHQYFSSPPFLFLKAANPELTHFVDFVAAVLLHILQINLAPS